MRGADPQSSAICEEFQQFRLYAGLDLAEDEQCESASIPQELAGPLEAVHCEMPVASITLWDGAAAGPVVALPKPYSTSY